MRLFIALELPPEARAAAAALIARLRSQGTDLKWVAPEALHLTLKFLGESDPALVTAIARELAAACQGVAPLALALDYRGASDFSSPLSLHAEREDLRFDGQLDVPALLAWSTASPRDSLLPPLRGRVQAALIEVSGAQLEGVVIEFEDDDAGSAP